MFVNIYLKPSNTNSLQMQQKRGTRRFPRLSLPAGSSWSNAPSIQRAAPRFGQRHLTEPLLLLFLIPPSLPFFTFLKPAAT